MRLLPLAGDLPPPLPRFIAQWCIVPDKKLPDKLLISRARAQGGTLDGLSPGTFRSLLGFTAGMSPSGLSPGSLPPWSMGGEGSALSPFERLPSPLSGLNARGKAKQQRGSAFEAPVRVSRQSLQARFSVLSWAARDGSSGRDNCGIARRTRGHCREFGR